jgi:hypothetical protein
LDHVTIRNLSDPVGKFMNWEGIQSLTKLTQGKKLIKQLAAYRLLKSKINTLKP